MKSGQLLSAEDDLCWYFQEQHLSEIGFASSMGSQIDTLIRGCSVSSVSVPETSDRAYQAMCKRSRIRSRLSKLNADTHTILWLTFGKHIHNGGQEMTLFKTMLGADWAVCLYMLKEEGDALKDIVDLCKYAMNGDVFPQVIVAETKQTAEQKVQKAIAEYTQTRESKCTSLS